MIGAGIVLFIIPLLLTSPIQPAPTTPPPTGGSKHGGNSGGGGTSPPPCASNCRPSTDTQPPTTTIQFRGALKWSRNGTTYFSPNITVTLHAVDDQNLTSIILRDNGTVTSFTAQGRSSTTVLTLTNKGLHIISYYAIDKAANKEPAHNTTVGLGRPDLSDIRNIIISSNIDNSGIKNALLAKTSTAEAQIEAGQQPNALNALSNQLNALDGKHGLDQATVDLIENMITSIQG